MPELHSRIERLRVWLRRLPGRLRRTSVRWARVIALGAIGAVTFQLVFPLAWEWWWPRDLPLSPSVLRVSTWLVVAALFYVVCEPIRIRSGHWRFALWYPPLWIAILLGWVGALAFERLRRDLPADAPHWWNPEILVAVGAALALALFVRQLPWKIRRHKPFSASPSITWRDVQQWIATERPGEIDEPDLFEHRPIAARIAQAVADEGRSVALLGPFGAGKSTIVNAVRADLERRSPLTIVAHLDAWVIPQPEDAPRLALSRMLSALDVFVDTIELRALPDAYQRLAAAEPTGIVAKVLGIPSGGDPIDEVTRLVPLLEALNARLVLIIEDVERAGHEFETRHLERLLWALRRFDRIAFVVAADRQHTKIDFAKLCDVVELVPPLPPRQTNELINAAYKHWFAAYRHEDIDPHQRRRESGKLGLGYDAENRYIAYISRTGRDTPLDALMAILSTPRALKHVMRQVDRTWQNLHGEAELDDIFIVAALRYGAQPVYEFLLDDIDPARHDPKDMLPRTKSVKADWTTLIEGTRNGPAVQRLVDLLGIKQLTEGFAINTTDSPQGVHVAEPVDYFRRITSGELHATELRDQQVLQQIDRWNRGEVNVLVVRLLAAASDDDAFCRLWEHFSFRHTEQQLLQLTSELAARVLERDREAATAEHPGIIALWRRIPPRVQRDDHTAWLQRLALNAIPVSLKFVNDLYYFWTGKYGIVTDEQRTLLRNAIVDEVKTRFVDGKP